jgi:hypothetical protein
MRRVIVSEYVTLDGVMDEPGLWSGPPTGVKKPPTSITTSSLRVTRCCWDE